LIKNPNLHHQLIKQNMTRITVAKGDGIGPEIMDATLRIIAAGAQLEIDEIEVEKSLFIRQYIWYHFRILGHIRTNKIFLKAPITTPQGGGYKSLNVTTRKFLDSILM
jgi:isocitrate dehydrogenase